MNKQLASSNKMDSSSQIHQAKDSEPSIETLVDHFRKLQVVVSNQLRQGDAEDCIDGGVPTKDCVQVLIPIDSQYFQAPVELETKAVQAIHVDNDQASSYLVPSFSPPKNDCVIVEEIVAEVGINLSDLDQEIPQKRFFEIGNLLPNWLKFAGPLGLNKGSVEDIRTNPYLDYSLKCQKVLEMWHKKLVFKATYRRLIDVCIKLDLCDVALSLCNMVKRSLKHPVSCTDESGIRDERQATAGSMKNCHHLATSQDASNLLVSGVTSFSRKSKEKRKEMLIIQQSLKKLESLSQSDDFDLEKLKSEKKHTEDRLSIVEEKLKELEEQNVTTAIKNARVVTNLDEKLKASTATNEKLVEANMKLNQQLTQERQDFVKELKKKDFEMEKLKACLLFYCVIVHAWWS